jgi:hypothetical protein
MLGWIMIQVEVYWVALQSQPHDRERERERDEVTGTEMQACGESMLLQCACGLWLFASASCLSRCCCCMCLPTLHQFELGKDQECICSACICIACTLHADVSQLATHCNGVESLVFLTTDTTIKRHNANHMCQRPCHQSSNRPTTSLD